MGRDESVAVGTPRVILQLQPWDAGPDLWVPQGQGSGCFPTTDRPGQAGGEPGGSIPSHQPSPQSRGSNSIPASGSVHEAAALCLFRERKTKFSLLTAELTFKHLC